jgi:hypothetical protein
MMARTTKAIVAMEESTMGKIGTLLPESLAGAGSQAAGAWGAAAASLASDFFSGALCSAGFAGAWTAAGSGATGAGASSTRADMLLPEASGLAVCAFAETARKARSMAGIPYAIFAEMDLRFI